jgi:fucose permease
MRDFRRTTRLCYFAMLVQALVVNLTPPLFIPLRTVFGFSFEQLGRLALLNFTTQVVVELVGGPLVDRFGARVFALLSQLLVFTGLWLFAWSDHLFATAYTGMMVATLVFSAGGGMTELLLTPIINALPSERKAADMNMLHSFYATGQFTTVLLTSLAVVVLGAPWRLVVMVWSLMPLFAFIGFSRTFLPNLMQEERRQRLRELVRLPLFHAMLVGIFLAGATEVAVAQWISAFAEKGLGLPKLLGDIGGCCLFAVMLGAGRVWMGLRTTAIDMRRVLTVSCGIAIGAYLVASLAPWPWLSLAACVMSGLGVSLLWPGITVLAARHFPRGGASMFALLAAAGALGCAVAPWLVGMAADAIAVYPATPALLAHIGLTIRPEPFGLRAGLLMAVVFPVLMLAVIRWIMRHPANEPTANRLPSDAFLERK